MATRLGIELSSDTCRIVEIDGGLDFRHDHPETRVTAFAMLPNGGPEVAARLSALRGRRATVVVWAPGADHRPVVVANAAYDRMQREALAAVHAAGRGMRRALTDIAPVADRPTADGESSDDRKRESFAGGARSRGGRRRHEARRSDTRRRTVLVASAPATEVNALVRPLIEAGIRVDHVLTPAAALLSLARTRRSLPRSATSQAPEVYVALDETATSVALVRNGAPIAATGLRWGFVVERGGHRSLRERGEIAARLAHDLSAFLDEGGLSAEHLQHVCIASGLPDLRSMAMTLMEQLDVEVEPLDSLFAIDGTRLPENADDCREHLPALRLAWAAAADEQPPLDLLRPERWLARRARLRSVAVTAGTAAGLVLGLAIQDRVGPSITVRPMPVLAASAVPLQFVKRVPAIRLPHQEPAFAPAELRRDRPAFAPMELRRGRPAFALAELRRGRPAFAPAELRRSEPARAAVSRRPVFKVWKEPDALGDDSDDIPPLTHAVTRPIIAIARKDRPGQTESGSDPLPLPLDAVLEGILVGPDRHLALVDGRIVEPGDMVRGARVVEITATSVVLRDERGHLRVLASSDARR